MESSQTPLQIWIGARTVQGVCCSNVVYMTLLYISHGKESAGGPGWYLHWLPMPFTGQLHKLLVRVLPKIAMVLSYMYLKVTPLLLYRLGGCLCDNVVRCRVSNSYPRAPILMTSCWRSRRPWKPIICRSEPLSTSFMRQPRSTPHALGVGWNLACSEGTQSISLRKAERSTVGRSVRPSSALILSQVSHSPGS